MMFNYANSTDSEDLHARFEDLQIGMAIQLLSEKIGRYIHRKYVLICMLNRLESQAYSLEDRC